jgi:hypothetical protein
MRIYLKLLPVKQTCAAVLNRRPLQRSQNGGSVLLSVCRKYSRPTLSVGLRIMVLLINGKVVILVHRSVGPLLLHEGTACICPPVLVAIQKIPYLMKTEVSLPCSQELDYWSESWARWIQSILPQLIISCCFYPGLLSGLFQVLRPTFCVHFSSLPCMLLLCASIIRLS